MTGPPVPAKIATIGEAMVAFIAAPSKQKTENPAATPDGTADHFAATVIGAESNVALGLTQLGHHVRWVSRLGADRMGDFVEASLSARGLDLSVARDPDRPTAICIKELGGVTATRMRYYRSGSACCALDGSELDGMRDVGWIHLSGVTPAISAAARQAVFAYLRWARSRGVRISFDVNYRPVLWEDNDLAAAVLTSIARQSDVVFAGDDEVEALTGFTTGQSFVDYLGLGYGGRLIVFKRGAVGAEHWDAQGRIEEPAREVDAVDVTGAGDAFAAGYLSALLRGYDPRARLRLGHLLASRAIATSADVGQAPERGLIDDALGIASGR